MQRSTHGGWLAAAGAVLAAVAIAASAYASHGVADGHARGNLQTAALYAFGHGAALVVLARTPARRLHALALGGLLLGTLLFAGSPPPARCWGGRRGLRRLAAPCLWPAGCCWPSTR